MSNDELQKAIDDITNGENAMGDSAANAADAGVASVPLPNDLASGSATTDLNMNFTETPDVNAGASADIFGVPPTPDISATMSSGASNPAAVAAPEVAPLGPDPVANFNAAPVDLSATPDFSTPVPITTPVAEAAGNSDLEAIKTAALLELYPLLPTMNVNPRQKYDICMTVIEKTGDKGATSVALDAAKMISDATEKGDCLMRLVEAINKL